MSKQLPLPLVEPPPPEPPPPILLECRPSRWKGTGRHPSRPRLFRVGDGRELRVRGPRAGRRLGQRYQAASCRLVTPKGRAPFWAAYGVVPLPPEDHAAAPASPPGNGPSPAQSERPPRRQRQRAA